MRQKTTLLILAILPGVILAGCGPGVENTATPLASTPAPVTSATAGATATVPALHVPLPTVPSTATAGADASPTAAVPPTGTAAGGSTPPGGGSGPVDIKITAFSVWQNFMPGPGAGSPPLSASVEFDVTNNGATALQTVTATHLVVRRGDGTTALDADVQGGSENARPGGLTPGTTLHYSYHAGPIPLPAMTENEAVTGILTVTVDGQIQTVPLPPTRVLFVQ